ncbi:hypothetical protein [Blastococcus capsensis]|uniref:hypothetical protein n=1 Tax=Blastococcus capsensis TaxID=1564163 RepID=UPI0025419FE6|nr:hypothetical protein [Blastococcus capsensis]MDK3258339.1 hypothetical protein [Blastococcus capsensis]
MSDSRDLPMHEAQHSFDVVLRGYDRSQVADTIERLEADFRIALADRDAAVARSADMSGQLSALHGEIESLRRKAATAAAPTFENISERIQHMLQLAEEEAGEIRRAAEIDAMAVREQTAAEERALLERHAAGQAEIERMIAEARQGAEQIAQKAQIRADELVAKAQERVARLDAESQARRAKVEEDFEIAQRARRAEAARAEEERERVSTQAARQRISAAEQHSAQLVAEAEARAEAIREVRDELTSRLLQARRLLDTLPDLGDRPQQPQDDAGATDRRTEPATGNAEPAAEDAPVAQTARPAPSHSPAPVAGPQTGQQPAVHVPQGEAAAARQPTRSDPVTATFATGQRAGEPPTRQLPLPPRPTSAPSESTADSMAGATAAPAANPATQSIDQPVRAQG